MSTLTLEEARTCAGGVPDPELPALTLADLGILRDVRVEGDVVEVDLTPTYSGCPAAEAIAEDVQRALLAAGAGERVAVRMVLAPAWTTDWMSEEGRRKLVEYGVAPPAGRAGREVPVLTVRCPRCGSGDTTETSRFGSSACRALWRCRSCLEPFDSFKVL